MIQTHGLDLLDVPTILTLAGLEIILSADNAIVLGALACGLPEHQRRRALFYGILGAFVLRFLAILGATWIIQFWWLQLAGGGYLIWLGIKHYLVQGGADPCGEPAIQGVAARGFWMTVLAIELTDLAFAVDSVLAAVGMSQELWVIYMGAVIGLVAMRFAAVGVLKLLEGFPALVHYAYVLVAWIGLKLVLQGTEHSHRLPFPVEIPLWLFWGVMASVMLAAFAHWLRVGRKRTPGDG